MFNRKRKFSSGGDIPRVMSPVRYFATIVGALAISALSWSHVQSQISNPGVQISGAVSVGNCAKFGPGVGQIQDSGGTCATFTPSAATKGDDTNVTLTLTGTPATALLQTVNFQLGWTGTLAAARLNSNVVQGVTNDTNVTGSIAAQNLTLGWTGTLGYARGGTNAATQVAARNNIFPAATTAGTLAYWDSTQWLILAGNNSGTNCLMENASGVPSFAACAVAGTGITLSGTYTVNIDKATAANLEAGASNKVLTADNIYDAEQTITFNATQTLDFNTFLNAQLTLTANITSLTCSNIKASQSGVIRLIQDGTGSRTMVAGWCSQFRWAGGVRGVLSTAAGSLDALFYQCPATTLCIVSLGKAYAN